MSERGSDDGINNGEDGYCALYCKLPQTQNKHKNQETKKDSNININININTDTGKKNISNFQKYINKIRSLTYMKTESINNINVLNLKFNNPKLNSLLDVLDKLIKNYIIKKNLSENQIKYFYLNYNAFKFSILIHETRK